MNTYKITIFNDEGNVLMITSRGSIPSAWTAADSLLNTIEYGSYRIDYPDGRHVRRTYQDPIEQLNYDYV